MLPRVKVIVRLDSVRGTTILFAAHGPVLSSPKQGEQCKRSTGSM